jgi:hypothetical protein
MPRFAAPPLCKLNANSAGQFCGVVIAVRAMLLFRLCPLLSYARRRAAAEYRTVAIALSFRFLMICNGGDPLGCTALLPCPLRKLQ